MLLNNRIETLNSLLVQLLVLGHVITRLHLRLIMWELLRD